MQSLLFSLIDVTLYSHFIQKTYLCGKYSAIGCVRVTVLSFFLTYLKLETGFGYPVPKMGNVANRYRSLQYTAWVQTARCKCDYIKPWLWVVSQCLLHNKTHSTPDNPAISDENFRHNLSRTKLKFKAVQCNKKRLNTTYRMNRFIANQKCLAAEQFK